MYDPAWTAVDWQQLAASPTPQAQHFFANQAAYAPEFVKEAHPVPVEAQQKLPDRVFGLIIDYPEDQHKQASRHFALTDMANTWLQMEALRHTGEQLPGHARKVAAWHVGAAALRHGLHMPAKIARWRGGMEGCSNRVVLPEEPDQVKQAAPPDDSDNMYGLVKTASDRRYPLHTPELVKQAMEYLEAYEFQFTPSQRYQMGTKIAARAKEENIPLTEKVSQYAYDGNYADTFGSAVAARTDYAIANKPESLTGLNDIAALADAGAQPWDVAEKVAMWDVDTGYDQMDHVNGMSAHQAVLGGLEDTEKVAQGDGFDMIDDRQLAGLVLRHQAKLSS